MASFGKSSLEKLATCDEDIQRVFKEVVKYFDCTIIEGHRGRAAQHKAYMDGKSELDWPNGKHNSLPSKAVDVMPYPIDWDDIQRLCYFAGFVMSTALRMGVKLRWGKDWDGDTDLNDQKFKDGPHFEKVG